MNLKAIVIEKMTAIVGEEHVISEPLSLKQAEPLMVRNYERAHRYSLPYQPLCVVYPGSAEETARVLKFCNENDIHVISRTGSSSSEDQLLVIDDQTIYVDGSRMNKIVKIDTFNMTVTAQCGTPFAELENKVNELGYTTGHAPQSIPLASLGGLIATRSTGQFSTYYGGIEDLVCGLEAILPSGEMIKIRPVPRRAAGPDLRHIIIGSEGTIAFITEATLKLFPLNTENMWKGGFVVENFHVGIDVVRQIMSQGYRPSVVRVYDKEDADHSYGSVALKDNESFMFFTVEGPGEVPAIHGKAIHEIALANGARDIGTAAVDHWLLTRNNICKVIGTETEYEKFRETGVWNSTIEICANWEEIGKIYDDAIRILPEKIPSLVMLGGHVSHSYMNGTNVYFVYAMKIEDAQNAHVEIQAFINALCEIILCYESATIVHHHGVGKLRVGYIKEELGSSFQLLRAIKDALDPNGIMNPGCLIPLE